MLKEEIIERVFVEEDLEANPGTSRELCLKEFLSKGGALHYIFDLNSVPERLIQLNREDAIYPVCSGGFCRSQALWALLQPLAHQIILFPPHAARVGWDPYNGKINRYKNMLMEDMPDAFGEYFGIDKEVRFGFENTSEWDFIDKAPTNEGLNSISEFYTTHYFGPESSWQGRRGKKRVYMTFSKNTHIVLYRLNQTNSSLKDVEIIAINSDDIITSPPIELRTTPRSFKAYEHFANLLRRYLQFWVQ